MSDDLARGKARTSYTLMTSGYISSLNDVCFSFFLLLLLLFFKCRVCFQQLTLTADSVKNNSVKLSNKFIVLKIQSEGSRRFKIQEANVAICSQTTTTSKTTQVDRLKLL